MAEDTLIDPRLALPVWLEPPTWASGVSEALEWQTWIGVSESMAEQRVAQRRYPRRFWDLPFRGIQFRQSLLQQMLVSSGRRQWLLPLYPYKARLSGSAALDTRQLFGDFALRQFVAGELVLIRDAEEFYRYEVGIVQGASDAQVTLVENLQYDWSEGTEVYPLRVCRMIEDARGSLRSPRVLDITVRFMQDTVEQQEVDVSDWETHPLDGLFILGIQHNWREDAPIQYQRQVATLDNQQSIPHYYDVGGQSNLGTTWRVLSRGRIELNAVRSMLCALRGQQNLVWLPTLSDDLQVVETVVPASGELVVQRVGLAQYGADRQDIKRDMLFEMTDGTKIFGRMVSARIEGDTEVVVLADNLEQPYEPEDFRRISFLVRARLAADRIEIQHHTDADGVQEIALPFLMLDNLRDV